MPLIRLAAAALNQTPLAWDANRDNILGSIREARHEGVGVLCLPELAITGYGCEDMFFAAGVRESALGVLEEIVPQTTGIAACVGLPLAVEGKLYNAAAVAADGHLLGFALKQFLAGDGIHYEPRWFQPWPAGRTEEVQVAGQTFLAGDVLFDIGPLRIGVEICRDAWMPDRPAFSFAERGANLLLNPSASHFAFAKQDTRRRIALEAAGEIGLPFVYSNLLGNESGRVVFDGGSLIAHEDRIVAEAPRLVTHERTLISADAEILEVTDRADTATSSSWSPAAVDTPRAPSTGSPWDGSPPPKLEEFSRAVPLGLFDYLRKSRANGFVVSLSGGADSSAVAVLVWLMVRFAVQQLGLSGVKEKLGHITALADAADEATVVRRLLTCVYQATRNSSQTTEDAARTVAESLGADFLCWNVDRLVDGYVDTVSAAVERSLDWRTDDIALQNIQARARGPGAWLLANLRGALLLATSNRSEAAVGYATMDGDTCGGLSPIAGIDKAFLREWLRWMETTGPQGIDPVPALAAVNSLAPTAELRPQESNQTDESDLMPYDVLDAIERAAIRDKQMPLAVHEAVVAAFAEHSPEALAAWVERFFRLWCRNQWKRERYAPSFHLDDENLDPKTWCRFPILSGGFERELAELRSLVGKG